MTQLLAQAMAEVEKLPQLEQDAIATMILDELADEARWQEAFARTQNQLSKLAAQAREEIQAGRVRKMGVDEL
jgi:hypothetical protein